MFENLKDIERFIYSHIPKEEVKYPGKFGLRHIKAFLKIIGNPEEKLKIIHVAGTSGKGSTAYFASVILRSQGFKVGLKLSPHISDIRERFQINNGFLSEKKMAGYFNELLPFYESFSRLKFGPLNYFEILSSFSFYIFLKEKVDFAVIETGLGGLFDKTNCIGSKNKTVIITKIGLDHHKDLGKTISQIAEHKAGIIMPGNEVISAGQEKMAVSILEKISRKKSSNLNNILENKNYGNINLNNGKISFDFNFKNLKLKNIVLKTPALYQVENCSLALAAVQRIFEKNKISLKSVRIVQKLRLAKLIGRMDTMDFNGAKVILDGAHNAQKMSALAKSLKSNFPKEKITFVLSVRGKYSFPKIADLISPLAKKIYISSYNLKESGCSLKSKDPMLGAKILKEKGFTNVEICPDPVLAIKKARKSGAKIIVATGSFFLLSEVYQKGLT